MLKKILLSSLLVTILFACQDKPERYNLKWNIPEKDVVIYNIQMKTIDSLSSVDEKGMQTLIESVSKIYGDSIKVELSSASLHKGLMQQLNMLSYFAIVRSDKKDNLKIDFITRQTKQYEPIKYIDIFNKFIKKAFFKGVLSTDGLLYTNEGAEVWDPKINILFQLPNNPIEIGESWALNIIPEWQKNKLDSNTVNKVTLTNIIVENGDSIAIIKYDLKNSESSGKTMGFQGNAKFNMTKGKWIRYDGYLSQKTIGMLSMKQVQKIELNEISVAKYKSILKQAQKTSLFDTGSDFEQYTSNIEDVSDKDTVSQEDKQVEPEENQIKPKLVKSDCPEVFRVQLLASTNEKSPLL